MSKKRLLVVLGPTATGKTDLALNLAKRFGGELIACDSRQVYRGLDIGTGKYPSEIFNFQFSIFKKREKYWEVNGVKIWMYDVVSPKRQYSVADYVKDAGRVVDQVISRGQLPIIVGGTGLYLKALLEGFPSLVIPVNKGLRGELGKLTVSQLQQRLKVVSQTRWRQMNQSDRQNPRRLVRVIEIVGLDSSLITQNDRRKNQNNVLKIGLTAPREILYQKINALVFNWVNQGIIEEVMSLVKQGVSLDRLRKLGLEYGLIADYLGNKIRASKPGSSTRFQSRIGNLNSNSKEIDQLIEGIQTITRQYAKRQITWFKKEKQVNWFDIISPPVRRTGQSWQSQVEKLVSDWYNAKHEQAD